MKSLLKKMTLEEKLGQLVQIGPAYFVRDLVAEQYGPAIKLGLNKNQIFTVGSVLGIGSPEEMIAVQKAYLKESRLKIPLVFMADIIHGYRTIFPVPLALASSFNEKLFYQMARISAEEASSSGVHVTFSPMADISRDPRWGRVVECFGEDPFLSYLFAYQMVKGYQTDQLKAENALASCVKHFAGYGASEAGRDYNTVNLSFYDLKQYYLAGYKGAIDAGAKLTMSAFNVLEGVPCSMNEVLLKDILRKELSFKGVVISDYNCVLETIAHGVSKNEYEAAVNCFKAGIDIEMASATYIKELHQAFSSKKLAIKLLDEAVLRVLKLKADLGLFENPYKGANRVKHDEVVFSKDHLDIALNASLESIVLLKNKKDLLPLKNDAKVFLAGPNMDENNFDGPWHWHGSKTREKSLKELLKANSTKIEDADYIIYFGGEKGNESGEARSKSDISFPLKQLNEIKALKKYNKKIILLVASGRPLVLTEVKKEVDSILLVWFLGTMATLAIKKTLFGVSNPSAKLPMSFPRSCGQIPIYYNHLPTGRPTGFTDDEYTSKYIDEKNDPLYPFGYGLSYTKFRFKNIKIKQTEFKTLDKIRISLDVVNEGKYDGYEVIQIYVNQISGQVSRPVKKLKAIKKVFVEKNETKKVDIFLNPKDLFYYNQKGEKVFDYGCYKVFIGNSSSDTKEEFLINFSGDNL